MVSFPIIIRNNIYYLYSGFVYYEGDNFGQGRNPYVPPNVPNPDFWACEMQKRLRGERVTERRAAFSEMERGWEDRDGPSEEIKEGYYSLFCEDVRNERARVGGDWVVADAGLIDKFCRDYVR